MQKTEAARLLLKSTLCHGLAQCPATPLGYNKMQYICAESSQQFSLICSKKPLHNFLLNANLIYRIACVLLVALAGIAVPASADEYTDVSQLMRSGQTTQALAKIEQQLITRPRDPQMRFFKGLIQRDTGKQTEAIATFTALTQEYPELPEPYNNLAVLYAAQNQFERALAALEMALKNNPQYAVAHENMGDVYARLAAQAYEKARQIDPGSNASVQPKLKIVKELFSLTSK